MHDDIKTVLLTKEEIDARVQEMGRQGACCHCAAEGCCLVRYRPDPRY